AATPNSHFWGGRSICALEDISYTLRFNDVMDNLQQYFCKELIINCLHRNIIYYTLTSGCAPSFS
ncbi:MAG: hypothetical protein WCF19_07595, partial [Chlamydiales bacterium]